MNDVPGSKGWTRVVYIDMTRITQPCPGNLTLISSPIRTCGGPIGNEGCTVAVFRTHE